MLWTQQDAAQGQVVEKTVFALPWFLESWVAFPLKNAGLNTTQSLGKIWTNPVIGLFRPSGWVTIQKVELNI